MFFANKNKDLSDEVDTHYKLLKTLYYIKVNTYNDLHSEVIVQAKLLNSIVYTVYTHLGVFLSIYKHLEDG